MAAKIQGGRKLAAYLRRAKAGRGSSGVSSVDVGFFSSARYPDGTPVAAVAAWNEFGTERNGKVHIPARPFFRNAIAGADEDLIPVLVEHVDPATMRLDVPTANRLGATMAARVQKSITTLRDPENAPSTKAAKGSSNPLIDTGEMRKSVTWRVNRDGR